MVETQGLEKNDIWELLRGKKSRVQLLQEKELQLAEIQKKISLRDLERRMSAGKIEILEKKKFYLGSQQIQQAKLILLD